MGLLGEGFLEDSGISRAVSMLGLEAKGIREEELRGRVFRGGGRAGWTFSSGAECRVADLLRALEEEGMGPLGAEEEEGARLLELSGDLRVTSQGKGESLVITVDHLLVSVDTGPAASCADSGSGKVLLKRVSRKERVCAMCRRGVGSFKKKYDVLVRRRVKYMCEECFRDFHWAKDGAKRYEFFAYHSPRFIGFKQ